MTHEVSLDLYIYIYMYPGRFFPAALLDLYILVQIKNDAGLISRIGAFLVNHAELFVLGEHFRFENASLNFSNV